MLGNLLAPEIEELLAARDYRAAKTLLGDLTAQDLADIITDLPNKHTTMVFRLLPKDKAADVFEYLEFSAQEELLDELKSEEVAHILEEMDPDDRTALLEELPPKAASALIAMLSPEERRIATTLLNYPEESVGRLMTTDFVYLHPEMTVLDALKKVRRIGIDRETVYALYVVDKARTLLGSVSLRRIVTSDLEQVVGDLMVSDPPKVTTTDDREDAAELIRRYDLIALPVADQTGKLVGIVTVDDLLDVIEAEHTEDVQMQAAVLPDERSYLEATVFGLVRRRIVWLVLLLGAEMIGVLFLRRYEETLSAYIALALFLPVMIATGGNTGTQSAALVIRAIATGEIDLRHGMKVLGRDLVVGVVLSVTLGVLAGLLCWAMSGMGVIGLCVGCGLAAIIVMSNLAGTLLPLVFEQLNMDPALMSGPFISTLVDVFGLVIYLQISLAIIAKFGS
ncbi:MAG: magnesium transporter [Sumerlaeia bacterium]